jgi:hypothetical protein
MKEEISVGEIRVHGWEERRHMERLHQQISYFHAEKITIGRREQNSLFRRR